VRKPDKPEIIDAEFVVLRGPDGPLQEYRPRNRINRGGPVYVSAMVVALVFRSFVWPVIWRAAVVTGPLYAVWGVVFMVRRYLGLADL
jgi:hypothetical protein